MLSRVADSLYWMARNIERAENNSRVLSARLINMLEASDSDAVAERDWEEGDFEDEEYEEAGEGAEEAGAPAGSRGEGDSVDGRRIHLPTGYEMHPWADLRPAGEGSCSLAIH